MILTLMQSDWLPLVGLISSASQTGSKIWILFSLMLTCQSRQIHVLPRYALHHLTLFSTLLCFIWLAYRNAWYIYGIVIPNRTLCSHMTHQQTSSLVWLSFSLYTAHGTSHLPLWPHSSEYEIYLSFTAAMSLYIPTSLRSYHLQPIYVWVLFYLRSVVSSHRGSTAWPASSISAVHHASMTWEKVQ